MIPRRPIRLILLAFSLLLPAFTSVSRSDAQESAEAAAAAETSEGAGNVTAPNAAASSGVDSHATHSHEISEGQSLPDVETVMRDFKEHAPPEVYQAGVRAVAEYESKGEELKKVVAEMRRTHTLYVNGYDRDKEPYLRLRDQSRVLINETFRAALDTLEYVPHTEAARFVVTMIDERFEHDVYDLETYEGAAKLLDYGVRWPYVVLGAARSAMVAGDFQLAENIYKNIDPERLEEEDQRLIALKDIIKQQYETEQELLKNDPEDLPQVRFLTSRGEIIADLFINEAPSTVANFITLAESGFYDGLDFFQVVDGLVALTGDPLGDGSSRPDRFIADEHGREVVRMPLAGSLVMAKLPLENQQFVPNSAGTQFSILFLPLPPIIQHQTVFGRVTKGMDILGALRRVDPHKEKKKNAVLIPPDRIIRCEILNRPETLPEIQYVDPPIGMPR